MQAVGVWLTRFLEAPKSQRELVELELQAANSTLNIREKKIHFESCFTLIRQAAREGTLSAEMALLYFTLLENFATQTCAGQMNVTTHDKEEGFRKSAAILEMSLVLQLGNQDDLARSICFYNSLEEMSLALGGLAPEQKGRFFDVCHQMRFDPQVVRQEAIDSGRFMVLAQSYMQLSFSYQDITSFGQQKSEESIAFQKDLTDRTLAIIGDNKPLEAKYRLARDDYMIWLKGYHDLIILSKYFSIKLLIQQAFDVGSFDQEFHLAQIAYKRARLYLEAGSLPGIEKARKCFTRAYELLINHQGTHLGRLHLAYVRIGLMKFSDLAEILLHQEAIKNVVDELRSLESNHVSLLILENALSQIRNLLYAE